MVAMQSVIPVMTFLAGFLLAWVILRRPARESETVFKALASDALARNNQVFLDLAGAAFAQVREAARGELEKRQQAIGELVAPVRASLDQVDARIRELESARAGAYAGLQEQVRGLLETQQQLRAETGKLVNWAILMPLILTARLSSRKRRPRHSGHSVGDM